MTRAALEIASSAARGHFVRLEYQTMFTISYTSRRSGTKHSASFTREIDARIWADSLRTNRVFFQSTLPRASRIWIGDHLYHKGSIRP